MASIVDGASEEGLFQSQAQRNASAFLEKYERYDLQELLAFTSTNWLLSTEDFKASTEPPPGLISSLNAIHDPNCLILIPHDSQSLDFREIHQIIRELTIGIYVLNQIPSISLESNFDQSSTCQIPPAYQDTRVGQILINIDYMMKALWHGAYFPKEKRTKFSERWRNNLDVNSNGKPETKKPLLTEFASAGMLDISKDPDYAKAYDKLPKEQPGDTEMAEERRFFMSHSDHLSMQLTNFQKSVSIHKNLFMYDADYVISSIVRLTEDKIDHTGYERLNARLQLHEIMLREHLPNKAEVRHQLHLMKFISFLIPFLIGMKKRMKIPDVNRLLMNMTMDETKTERELPPLILGPDFRCKNFSFGSHFFHLNGGIVIDIETDSPAEVLPHVKLDYSSISEEATQHLNRILDPEAPLQESYPVPLIESGGKKYYAISVDFETYYPQSPQKPLWVHCMWEEIMRLRPKRLPISDNHIYEQNKKFFSFKRATKYKSSLPSGLRAAAQRGMVAVFACLCRKCPAARLGKQDETGLSLIHHAAMNNRPQIITLLIMQSMDVNVRRNNNILSTDRNKQAEELPAIGPTALHLAARCGAVDAMGCLLANYANVLVTDQDGWAPIHHAAFYDQEACIKMLIRRHDSLLEIQTKNDLKSTPLLLAANAGALAGVKCLIQLGAHIGRQDEAGNNIVHLAALRFHTNVLEFFIEWNHPDVKVWEILVGMLKSEDVRKKDSAVKCLEVLSTSDPQNWKAILEAGGVSALVDLLTLGNEDLRSVAASVLCNISEQEPIRKALAKANAGPILIQLLGSSVDDIQSRAAIVLSDLACVDNNQSVIASQGGIPPLVNLLESELEDVLVNAVNAIRVMCLGNSDNQSAVARCGGVEPLVEFLTVNSDVLQAATSGAIAALTAGHTENQGSVVREGAVKPIVDLIKGRNVSVQVKAASALEALAEDNPASQKVFLDLDAPKALIKLLKIWSMEVKEQGAVALWSLAGQTNSQQKYIAERIGIHLLIEMLLLKSERLQYVGCMAMIALGREDVDNQNKIAKEGGLQPLVRLLRNPKTSERVLMAVIQALGTLCVGVAHVNNKVTQKRIAEENAVEALVALLVSATSQQVQVEVANTLGCVVLSNLKNQERLKDETGFRFNFLLELLSSPDEKIRLRAGMALSIFAFNNTPQQFSIREAGGITFDCFRKYIESTVEYYQCQAAFQIVVLARVIVDMDQVVLTARGVTTLVNILKSKDDHAVVLSASLMSSLAHTRAGITDAMITSGSIELLVNHLSSLKEQVRRACAIALGYLSFNRTAARMLLVACRNTPGLYKLLMANIGKHPKICPDFVDEFRRAKIVGLPSQSLEVNGGPPVIPPSRREARRPRTSLSYVKSDTSQSAPGRATSAPAASMRAQSAKVSSVKHVAITTNNNNNNNSKRPTLSKNLSTPPGLFKTSVKAWNGDGKK